MDYSGNKGICKIENITLAQGAYTYCEYDQNHHKIYECSNEVISIQTELLQKKGYIKQREEIEYFYNPKDLLEKKTSINKIEHFNLDEMIIKKDVLKLETVYSYNKQGKLLKEQDSNGKICEYVYNNGICIQKRLYHSSMPNMMYLEEYDDKKKPEFETNDLGFKDQYHYLNNSIVSVTTPNGNVLYSYSSDNANSLSTDINGEENFNTTYYDKGRLIELKTDGMNYRYTYDEFGREKELYINDKLYCCFKKIKIEKEIFYQTIYCDKTGYEKVTDLYDKVLKINKLKEGKSFPYIIYEYDEKDNIKKEYHYLDNQEEIIEYVYVEDVLVGIRTKGYTKIINHDLYSNETLYQIGDTKYSNQINIDRDGKVINYHYSINHSNDLQETYSYDVLDRLNEVENPLIKQKYYYLAKNGRTTNLISTLQKKIKDKYQRYNYSYDKEGNICAKKENQQFTRYKFDQLNRLVREDNEELNQTILYSYNSNGNLLNKEIYSYSLTDYLENKQTIEYNYSDFNDYLTQFNGREIKYDTLGKPILYKDIPLVWKERELKKYGDIEYAYDVNHIRTKKHSKDYTIEYMLDGTTILKEKRKYYTTYLESIIEEDSYIDTYKEELEYIYSNQGMIGFDYRKGNNRKRYYYNKNIFGDILEIYDEEGSLVGKYSYDAYGNHKILIDVEGIASINPHRYRSYYYDSENGFYYCNSRYYDPETGRFISPDSIEYLNPKHINGLNLYAYCLNNPVMYVDPTGHFGILIAIAILSIAFLSKKYIERAMYKPKEPILEGADFNFDKNYFSIFDTLDTAKYIKEKLYKDNSRRTVRGIAVELVAHYMFSFIPIPQLQNHANPAFIGDIVEDGDDNAAFIETILGNGIVRGEYEFVANDYSNLAGFDRILNKIKDLIHWPWW